MAVSTSGYLFGRILNLIIGQLHLCQAAGSQLKRAHDSNSSLQEMKMLIVGFVGKRTYYAFQQASQARVDQ